MKKKYFKYYSDVKYNNLINMSSIESVFLSNPLIQDAKITNPIINVNFVASDRPKIHAKICVYPGCKSTHSYSCPGCGSVHSTDCTCVEDNVFDYAKPKITVANAIKFVSHNAFTSLVDPTSYEIAEYERVLVKFFSEWRERTDVSFDEIHNFLFYDAEGVLYDCMDTPLDLNLQKAIQYYSNLQKQGRFEEKPRYFCDYPGSSLNTVNTLDSLIYEIIVYIKNHREEFAI